MLGDREDYLQFLEEAGITQEAVDAILQIDDVVAFPGPVRIERRASPIHGDGMFATGFLSMGQRIAPARINGRRTLAGRYVNHSSKPNCIFEAQGHDLHLVALRGIGVGEEVTIDYRQAGRVNPGALQFARGIKAASETTAASVVTEEK